MSNDDDVDLRYLQSESFLAEFLTPRFLPRNAFLPRMSANLRPGFSGQFDLETIATVLCAAANARHGQVIHACLIFQGKGALMHICSIEPEMVCICADMGENLIPALYWYRAQGDSQLNLAVAEHSYFWLPLPAGTQSRE